MGAGAPDRSRLLQLKKTWTVARMNARMQREKLGRVGGGDTIRREVREDD